MRDHPPLGWFETPARSERFLVRHITAHPGGALSLQGHYHRVGLWIIVSGTARATVDGVETLTTENQSIHIPLGVMHRLENPGKVPMGMIEVQTGTYPGENDIPRYEDIHSRD